MKKKYKQWMTRTVSLVLTVCLTLGLFSGLQVSAEDAVHPDIGSVNEDLWTPGDEAAVVSTEGDLTLEELAVAELAVTDIPEVISAQDIEEKGHVNRLRAQEEDLNTVIFQNRDGTKTLYYFGEPVKYVDENGNVRDKSNGIAEVAQARYVADYRYTNTANDVKCYFPGTLNSDKGILLEYGDIRIEVRPTHAVQTGPAVELEEEKAAEEERNPSETLIPAEEVLPPENQQTAFLEEAETTEAAEGENLAAESAAVTVLPEDTAVQQPEQSEAKEPEAEPEQPPVEEEENRAEILPPVEEVQKPEVFVPQRVEVQAAESLKKTLEAEAEQTQSSEVVEYEGIFGPHTTLRYTPTFSGFKEDIILNQNIGVNEFSFVVDAGELQATAEGGALFFLNPLTGDTVAQMNPVYIYDSYTGERTEEKPHESFDNQLLCETLPDGRVLVTLVADSDFLNDPDTVYPVYVDPSVTVQTQGSGSGKSIQDIVVYSGRRQYNHSSNPYMHVGYYDSTYGAGRTLVKFPGLTNHALFKSLDASQITGAAYYIYKSNDSLSTQTTSVSAYRYTGVPWTESTAKCTNISWNGYTDLQETRQVSGTAQGYVGFNILGAAKLWKTNSSAANLGLMLKNSNEYSRAYDRNFLSTRYGSNKPYVTLSWNANTPSGITNNGVYYFQNVCSGKYLDIYNNETSNNTPLIQYSLGHTSNQRFKLVKDYATGYYRIRAQNTDVKRVLLLNTSNQVVLSDDCSSERALWRIKDEGNGRYSFINKASEGTYAYAMSNGSSGTSGTQIKGETYTSASRFKWTLLKDDLVTKITLNGVTYTVIGEDFEIEDERTATFTGTHIYANSMPLEHVRIINGKVYVCLPEITPWLGLSVPRFYPGTGNAYKVQSTHSDVTPNQSYYHEYPYTQLETCPVHGNNHFMVSLDTLMSDMGYTQLGKVSQISYKNGAKEIFIQGPGHFIAGQNHVSPLNYIASMELSMIPGVGDIKDAVEAVSGKDFLTGDTLAGWERVLSLGCALLPVVSYSGVNASIDGIKGITKVDEVIDVADTLSDTARAAFRAKIWDTIAPVLRGVEIEFDYAKNILKQSDGWRHIGKEMNGYYPVIDFVKKTGSNASTISMKSLDPRCLSYTTNGVSDVNKIKNTINRYATKYAKSTILVEGASNVTKELRMVVPPDFVTIVQQAADMVSVSGVSIVVDGF